MPSYDTFDFTPATFESEIGSAGPVVDMFDFRVLALAPTVTVVTPSTSPPPVGGVTPFQKIVIDVSNDKNAPIQILVAKFVNRGIEEVIHNTQRFSAQYDGNSTVEPIAVGVGGGFRYSILRNGGWFESPEIITYPLLQVEGE